MPSKPPWKKPRPAGSPKRTLSDEAKAWARASAEAAGRPYPNLIDNMAAAKAEKAGTLKPPKRR